MKLMFRHFSVADGEAFDLPEGYDVLGLLEYTRAEFGSQGYEADFLLKFDDTPDDADLVQSLQEFGAAGGALMVNVNDREFAHDLIDPYRGAVERAVEPTPENLTALLEG